MYLNRHYIIIPTKDLTQSMIKESMNTKDSIRYSVDKEFVLLKFNYQFPDIMSGYVKYTYDEIKDILAGEDW